MSEAVYMIGIAVRATWWYTRRRLALWMLDAGAELEEATR